MTTAAAGVDDGMTTESAGRRLWAWARRSRAPSAPGWTILRIALGTFFLFQAFGKLAWFADGAPLAGVLNAWLQQAVVFNRWYLEWVALPGAPVFSRMVALAELSTGVALLTGFCARPVAIAACLMVFNFHVASGALFQYRFLTNGYGLPVLGGLLGLAFADGTPIFVTRARPSPLAGGAHGVRETTA